MNENIVRHAISSVFGFGLALLAGHIASHYVNLYFTLLTAILVARVSLWVEIWIISVIQKKNKE